VNRDTLKHYLAALLVLLLLDGVWLGLVARNFYKAHLGFIMADHPVWAAAGIFYLLYVGGLVVFVVSPGVRERRPGRAALKGAFFGLVAYATYDLTNLATVERWPLAVTLVDLAWGAVLSAATAGAAVWFFENSARKKERA
jgi:uncharacterized membrane protein